MGSLKNNLNNGVPNGGAIKVSMLDNSPTRVVLTNKKQENLNMMKTFATDTNKVEPKVPSIFHRNKKS